MKSFRAKNNRNFIELKDTFYNALLACNSNIVAECFNVELEDENKIIEINFSPGPKLMLDTESAIELIAVFDDLLNGVEGEIRGNILNLLDEIEWTVLIKLPETEEEFHKFILSKDGGKTKYEDLEINNLDGVAELTNWLESCTNEMGEGRNPMDHQENLSDGNVI